jgi:hypothetical protein
MRATVSAVALPPSSVRTGSPGSAWTRRKVTDPEQDRQKLDRPVEHEAEAVHGTTVNVEAAGAVKATSRLHPPRRPGEGREEVATVRQAPRWEISRADGRMAVLAARWIPAFAGMTKKE